MHLERVPSFHTFVGLLASMDFNGTSTDVQCIQSTLKAWATLLTINIASWSNMPALSKVATPTSVMTSMVPLVLLLW